MAETKTIVKVQIEVNNANAAEAFLTWVEGQQTNNNCVIEGFDIRERHKPDSHLMEGGDVDEPDDYITFGWKEKSIEEVYRDGVKLRLD